MPHEHSHPLIEYDVFSSPDADEMARLLGETFSRHDPPARAVGLTSSEMEALVRLFCPKAAVEGLTIVARLAGTGELVGVLLTEDRGTAHPADLDGLSQKFGPVLGILGELDTEYRGESQVRPGESLHLFLLGVAKSVTGRGVAQRLVSTCLEHGAAKGYRLAVTEATNATSQHIFRKLGFVERVHRSYRTYRFNGHVAFASIADHGGPILMDKSLA
jgi:ribosomal protein S18 acetylase RimI-like enzyme